MTIERGNKPKNRIDPDFSPDNIQNREAAQELGLKYDLKCQVYRDSDGCPVLDKFGQDLG